MTAKKVRYLLEERGRYYYQRKVPKALEYYVGKSRWHIPVGNTFDAAQTAVAKLRTEHDSLIANAKADPKERTKLRRAKEANQADLLRSELAREDAYREDVIAGAIDDPEELLIAECEDAVASTEPFWLRTDEYLQALEHERTATVNTGIATRQESYIFTDAAFEVALEPVRHLVSEGQIEEWRERYVGKSGIAWFASIKRQMEDDEYYDNIKAHYEFWFSAAQHAPTDEDARLDWDVYKMKLERIMARYAPPADRLTAVFEDFLKFSDIKTEKKYRRVFAQFILFAGDIPLNLS